MRKLIFFILILYSYLGYPQIYFNTSPFWISTDVSNYSTGCGWADINKDGWLDLVVANGNDMARQKVVVYISNSGVLPTTPSWVSNDIDYHGHLSIGDVNNDGFPDVAVSVYIGPGGFGQRGKVKIYMNNNGVLTSNPAWVSADTVYTFSCAFGDADNDGDLDLAVASGESYNLKPEQMRVYYNNNGIFESLPSWKSVLSFYAMDVTWADINKDGKLDLIFCCERGPNRMFLNYGDSIATVHSWVSTDASQYANSLFVDDVNGDGWLDLAVSDNNQLGGSGKFKIYLNNSGTLATTPFWSSSFSGYGSGINLARVTASNFPHLICGGWWTACRIYENANGTFQLTPQWTSATSSVVEAIVCADYDNDGISSKLDQFSSNGTKKLYYLSRYPVHKIQKVVFGTDSILPSQYCYDLENGWIVLKNPPPSGTTIKIYYYASYDLDFAVTNWDNNKGNYLFKNSIVVNVNKIAATTSEKYELYQNYPNPFNPETNIKYIIPKESNVRLVLYDQLGKEIITLVNKVQPAGEYLVVINMKMLGLNLTSGVYYYSLIAGDFKDSKRLILAK